MKLDEHILRLIAVGAATAMNCTTCLEACIIKARENGAQESELAQAIWVGKQVRRCGNMKMDELGFQLLKSTPGPITANQENCACKD